VVAAVAADMEAATVAVVAVVAAAVADMEEEEAGGTATSRWRPPDAASRFRSIESRFHVSLPASESLLQEIETGLQKKAATTLK
jgi:hypothetical protein